MKLTKYMREAFVRAAMHDVPQVDYQEQAAKLVHEHLDKEYAKAFKGRNRRDDMACAECSGWLERINMKLPGSLSYVYTAAVGRYDELMKHSELWKKLSEIEAKNSAQSTARNTLQRKIEAVADSVTTRKALAGALPEFEKYLPEDEAKATRMLPVVTNVVADFVKAGWPKQEPKKEAAKPAAKKATKKVSAK